MALSRRRLLTSAGIGAAGIGLGAGGYLVGQNEAEAAEAETMGAVAWSFLGIRRSKDHERDMKRLNPLHVVLAALLGVALFILFLAALVHFATSALGPSSH